MSAKGLVGAGLLAFFLGCSPEKPANPTFQSPEAFKLGLGKVYAQYHIVITGLTSGSTTVAFNSLAALHGMIHEVPTEGLDSAAKAYWDSGNVRIMGILHQPGMNEGGIQAVRKVVMELSPMLLDRIERYGMRPLAPVHLFRCPKTGTAPGALWMQKDPDLRNPYMGDSLAGCGTKVREINNFPWSGFYRPIRVTLSLWNLGEPKYGQKGIEEKGLALRGSGIHPFRADRHGHSDSGSRAAQSQGIGYGTGLRRYAGRIRNRS